MGVENKNKFLIKFLFSFVFTLLIIGAVFISTDVFAITVDPGLGATLDLGTSDLKSTVISIIQWALGLLGLVAVVMILYGGFLWMTARGNEEQLAKAKKVLKQATIGLIIILLSWAIVAFIVSRINDATSPYPAHCSNGVLDLAEGETGIDCGGPCPSCGGSGSLPVDEFTWEETQVSVDTGGDVNRCSRLQPVFNHRIDGDTFATYFNTNNSGEIWIDGFPAPPDPNAPDFSAHPMELDTTRNSVTLKHNDELFPANTDMTLWIPEDVRDNVGEPLAAAIGGAILGTDPRSGNDAYYWDFHVGNEVDLIAPYITNTYPYSPPDSRHPSRNVSMSPIISVDYNENIDATTIDDGSGNPIVGNFVLEQLSNPSVCTGGGANDGDYCTANGDCDSGTCTVSLKTTCQGGADDGEICTANGDCDSNVCSSTIDNTKFDVGLESAGFNIALDNGYLFDAFGWYRISVSGVEDLCGNTIAETKIWEFQTTDLQPGISGRYPTGPDACEGNRVYVGFNTTMYYNHVDIEVSGGGQTYNATMYAEGIGLPGNPFATPGTNGSIFRIIDTDNFNQFRGFELILPVSLIVGTTYTVEVNTDKVMNIGGDLLEDTWNFTVKSAAECRCAPLITNIDPDAGQMEQCVTISGYCFDGAGKATLTDPTIIFTDADGDPADVPAVLGGYGSNFATTVIPGAPNFEYGGDVNPVPQIQITYDPVYNLGTASSSNVAIRYYIEENVVSTGPCLWSLNPVEGPVNTQLDLNGDRFVPATAPNQRLNFVDGGSSFVQNNFSIWNNDFIRSWANTTPPAPPPTLLEGATYDVSVTTDGGDSNEIEFFIVPTPPDQSNVINQYPTCTSACVNADVGATITKSVDTGTLDFTTGSGSVRLFQCTDDTCNNFVTEIDISASTFSTSGSDVDLEIAHANFDVNTSYRMILTQGITNASGGTIGTNYNYSGNQVFSWIFKTKDDPEECTIESVILAPQVHQMATAQTRQYVADAYGSPDSCNPGGQQLNSQVATWAWSTSDNTVADVSGSATREDLATGVAAGVCQIDIDITDVGGDTFNDDGDLTITDCDTDAHCQNNCTAFPGNGSVCIDHVCTPWIGSIDPNIGPETTTTTIRGCYFDTYDAATSAITFGGPGNLGDLTTCDNSWTNTRIIAQTPALFPGLNLVEVITRNGYSNVVDSGQNDVFFERSNFCGRLCDIFSYNAGEICDPGATPPLLCPGGSCLPAGIPPLSGMPGLCATDPTATRIGNPVDFLGYNFDAVAALGEFSRPTAGFERALDGTVNFDGTRLDDATVPVNTFTGPARVVVSNGGEFCASNEVDFELSCDSPSDCIDPDTGFAPGCCYNNVCSEMAWCATGGPGSLCQLPSNTPNCQAGLPVVNGVYSCIDFEGHSDPYVSPSDPGYPPAPGGVAPGTDCRQCCAPGQSNGSLLCNTEVASLCDGNLRGIYCGCDYDPADPNSGDLECGAQACGNNTCCYNRPEITSVVPSDGSVGICRNAQINIIFSSGTKLDRNSVNNNTVKLSAGGVDIPSTVTLYPSQEVIAISPVGLFDIGANIQVFVKGGPDGVLSDKGIAMMTGAYMTVDLDPQPLDTFIDAESHFTVGDEICRVDHFNINKEQGNPPTTTLITAQGDLFTCAGDTCSDDLYPGVPAGNQHEISVWPVDANNQILNFLPFTWDWSEYSDPLDIMSLSDAIPPEINFRNFTSNNENGRAVVRVSVNNATYGSLTRDIPVRNLLCENSWPDKFTEVLPFEDTDYNFSTWYCLDSGLEALESVDDIGITSYPTPNVGVDELQRQYFIEWPGAEDQSDSIGIQIWQNESGLSARDWYYDKFGPAAPEPQALTIDGYSAVRDGRTVYIAAFNVNGTGPGGQPSSGPPADRLYPNIYLISHSESASQEIVEIFNALVNNFELNSNIDNLDDKFAMQRDLTRVQDLNTVYSGLNKYFDTNDAYPLLPGGTFIQKMSTSAWPSWSETLGSVIGIDMPKDPINKFESCPYSATDTCWDDANQQYRCLADSHIYQFNAVDKDDIDLFAHLEKLNVVNTSPETFYWGTSALVDECGDFPNAQCPCFNYSKNTAGIITDRIGPDIISVNGFGPGSTQLVSGVAFNLSVSVTDDDTPESKVEKVEFWVDGQFRYRDEDGSGPGWSWAMNTTDYEDGVHTLQIRAYDNYGNLSMDIFNLDVNNSGTDSAPFVDITNVAQGQVISGSIDLHIVAVDNNALNSVTLTAVDSEGNGNHCLGNIWVGPATPFSANITWNTYADCMLPHDGIPDTPNGNYTIRLTAVDNSGLSSTKEVYVQVQNFDVLPPEIIIHDIDGNCSNSSWDCNGVGPCRAYDMCTLVEPQIFCPLGAACNQSNENTQCDPDADCLRYGTKVLQFTVTDINEVESVTVFVDGNNIGQAENVGGDVWEISWNTLNHPNGIRNIQVIAEDIYNNQSTASIDIVVDNLPNDIEPPTVEFIIPPTPNYGVAVDGIINLSASATDNLGVVGVYFFIDYRVVFYDKQPGWDHSVDTTHMTDGWHSFQVISVDSAGNFSEADEIVVNVRGSGGPNISDASVYPTTGGIGTTRCFQATVTDNEGVQYVTAIIQDENENNLFTINMIDDNSDDIYNAIWTSTVEEGAFFVDIEAMDTTGNISRFNNIDGVEGICGLSSSRLAAGSGDGRLYISDDDIGSSWTEIANFGDIIFDFISASNGDIYVATANAGNIYKSDDGGTTFNNTANLTSVDGDVTEVYSLFEDSDGTIYAGTRTSGGGVGGRVFKTIDGGATWNTTADLSGAERVHTIIKATDNYIYVGTRPRSEVFRSNNGGNTWESRGNLIDPAINANVHTLIQANDGSFYAGLFKTLVPPETVGSQVWKSTNLGQNWGNTGAISAGTDIYSLVQANDNSILAGNIGVVTTPGSALYRSTTGGTSWNPSPTLGAKDVYQLFKNYNGDIYAGTGGTGGGNVWRSTDNGQTWVVTGGPGVRQVFSVGSLRIAEAPSLHPPIINSGNPITRTAFVGNTFNYQITTDPLATTYYATNLPSWLTLNSSSGLISSVGVIPASATISSPYTIGLRAENYDGLGPTVNLTLSVTNPPSSCNCVRATPACTGTSSASCNAIQHCDWNSLTHTCYYDGYCYPFSEAKCNSNSLCQCLNL